MLLAFTYQERMRTEFCGIECDKKQLGGSPPSPKRPQFTILSLNLVAYPQARDLDGQIAPEGLSASRKLSELSAPVDQQPAKYLFIEFHLSPELTTSRLQDMACQMRFSGAGVKGNKISGTYRLIINQLKRSVFSGALGLHLCKGGRLPTCAASLPQAVLDESEPKGRSAAQ